MHNLVQVVLAGRVDLCLSLIFDRTGLHKAEHTLHVPGTLPMAKLNKSIVILYPAHKVPNGPSLKSFFNHLKITWLC